MGRSLNSPDTKSAGLGCASDLSIRPSNRI